MDSNDNVIGIRRYIILSEWTDILSGDADLINTIDTKYTRSGSTPSTLLHLNSSNYSVGDFILDGTKTYYFYHENNSTFSFSSYDYISKSKVQTRYNMDGWMPSYFINETEFQISY